LKRKKDQKPKRKSQNKTKKLQWDTYTLGLYFYLDSRLSQEASPRKLQDKEKKTMKENSQKRSRSSFKSIISKKKIIKAWRTFLTRLIEYPKIYKRKNTQKHKTETVSRGEAHKQKEKKEQKEQDGPRNLKVNNDEMNESSKQNK